MEDNEVEDNDKYDNNSKVNNNDKGISALGLDKDLGFREEIKDIKGIGLMMMTTRTRTRTM